MRRTPPWRVRPLRRAPCKIPRKVLAPNGVLRKRLPGLPSKSASVFAPFYYFFRDGAAQAQSGSDGKSLAICNFELRFSEPKSEP